MLAPKIAKAQPEAAESSNNYLPNYHPRRFENRPDHRPTESLATPVNVARNEPAALASAGNGSWDFSRISIFPPDHSLTATPGSIQPKLEIGAVDDPLERDADRVAEGVMRAPGPGASSTHVLQRKCAVCTEEQGEGTHETVARKDAPGAARDGMPAPPIVKEVLSSPGQPLDRDARAFFEPRFGHDFSRVRIHAGGKAAESAQAVGALAYTVGQHVVFGESQYGPGTPAGHRILAHELAHTIQQSAPVRPRLQRTKQVTLKKKNQPSMTLVIGELRLSKDAKDDLIKSGALLPGPDQAHIGFSGDQLGYDPNFTDPTDPYRWNKLKEIIDSDVKISIRKVSIGDQIKILSITPTSRVVVEVMFRHGGLTFVTEDLNKKIFPKETEMKVSPDADTNQIFYTTAFGSPADSSMAHELFGHMWLALRGVPFIHPSDPAEIAAKGTLTAQHKILDPFGNVFTGTVQDYIDRYVGSSGGVLNSPTQNVGPQLLQKAFTDFETSFKTSSGTLNGSFKYSGDTNLQWGYISGNYALAPQSAPSSSGTQTPAPAPKPTGSQPATPAPATSTPPAVTQASIEQHVTAWYKTLNPDQQYVFLRFLNDIQADILRRTQLTFQMLNTLPHPQGMTDLPSPIMAPP